MADFNKRGPGCDDDCDGEGGERGKRGKRGHRGHDGRDGRDGALGATGPTGPGSSGGGPIVTDPTPPTLLGDGTAENPLQVINVAPQPFTEGDENRFIFANAGGSDETGDGTEAFPFLTLQRAVMEVPLFIPGGVFYYVNVTGLGSEELPDGYELPTWKATRARQFDFEAPFFPLKAAVNIFADPQLVDLGGNEIITDADFIPTEIGGGIVSPGGVTNTAPIVVTTNLPHGLLVSEDPIQQVIISGVTGVPSANGPWLVLVTGPNTFELVDSDGSGDPGPSVGGIVELLFFQDDASGLLQVKTSKSFGADDSLVGKLLIGNSGPFDQAVIYHNTNDTLFITRAFRPEVFPGFEFRIMEQSAELVTTFSGFGRRGGFNVMNIDSIALNGLRIAPADPEQRGLFQFGSNLMIQGCALVNPVHQTATHDVYVGYSDVVNAITQVWMVHDRSLHRGDGTEFELFTGERLDSFESVYMDMFGIFASSDVQMQFGKLLRTVFGFVLFEGEVDLGFVSFEDISEFEVLILGQARFDLGTLSSNRPPGTVVLFVDQGGVALIDETTFSSDQMMKVGTRPPRSFADFYAGIGGPVGTYTDFTSVDPVEGATGRGGSVLDKS